MPVNFTVENNGKNVLNKNGVLQENQENFPAFEFNSDGSYKGLLVESAATNYEIESSTITGWTSVNTTKTVDQTTAPDGVAASADEVLETTANDTHVVRKDYTLGAGSYVFSCFVKSIGGRNFQLLTQALGAGGSGSGTVQFNLSTGTVASGTGTITEIGDGWYRVSSTAVTPGATGIRVIVYSLDGVQTSFPGDTTKGFYIWGMQLEESDKATSYIPTSGTTVTRAADYIYLDDPSSTYLPESGTVIIKADFGKSYNLNILGLTANLSGEREVKFTYSDTEIELFVDGTSVGLSTGTYDFSGMDIIEIGSFNNSSHFNRHLQYFAIQ